MRNKKFFLICPLFLFLHNQCSKISQKKAQMHKKNKNKPKPIEKLVKFYPKEIILMRKNDAKKQCPFVRVLWHYDTYLST